MKTKDGKETSVENLTAENYAVPSGEERLYHCVIESKLFDSKTGRKLSTPRVQKFGMKIYERVVRPSLLKQGVEIIVLHDAKKWTESHAREIAAAKKEQAEKRAQNEQAKFDAAVAAAVEKALAEKGAAKKSKKDAKSEEAK